MIHHLRGRKHTFSAKVLAVNETEIQLQLIAFWSGHINEENIQLNTSSNRPPFATTEKAILKVKEKYGENSYYEKLIKLYTKMLEEGE